MPPHTQHVPLSSLPFVFLIAAVLNTAYASSASSAPGLDVYVWGYNGNYELHTGSRANVAVPRPARCAARRAAGPPHAPVGLWALTVLGVGVARARAANEWDRALWSALEVSDTTAPPVAGATPEDVANDALRLASGKSDPVQAIVCGPDLTAVFTTAHLQAAAA